MSCLIESRPFAPQKIDDVCLIDGAPLTKGLWKHCTTPGCRFVIHVKILGTPGFGTELRVCPVCNVGGYGGNGSLWGTSNSGQDVWSCSNCGRAWMSPPPSRISTHAYTRNDRIRRAATTLAVIPCDCGSLMVSNYGKFGCKYCGRRDVLCWKCGRFLTDEEIDAYVTRYCEGCRWGGAV
jgi:hypothetical protein